MSAITHDFEVEAQEPEPPQPARRFYMKHSIVTAEQQPDGSWQVRGPSWLKYAEFDDEDFRMCFEEIL